LIQHKEKYWKDCKRTKQAYFSQDYKPLEQWNFLFKNNPNI
jgi:hypothetical protein